MRLFVGVRIPEDIKERIAEVSHKLYSKVKEAKIVATENLHITLKFLGGIQEDKVSQIKNVLTESLKGSGCFPATVRGVGIFPDEKSIRVFWVGVDSKGKLKKLNASIETELEPLGFTREDRFKEHITIARFKSTPKITSLKDVFEKYKEEIFGLMDITKIELIKSDLKSAGPVYTTICEVYL